MYVFKNCENIIIYLFILNCKVTFLRLDTFFNRNHRILQSIHAVMP